MDISELLLTEEERAVRALSESQDTSDTEGAGDVDPPVYPKTEAEGGGEDPSDYPEGNESGDHTEIIDNIPEDEIFQRAADSAGIRPPESSPSRDSPSPHMSLPPHSLSPPQTHPLDTGASIPAEVTSNYEDDSTDPASAAVRRTSIIHDSGNDSGQRSCEEELCELLNLGTDDTEEGSVSETNPTPSSSNPPSSVSGSTNPGLGDSNTSRSPSQTSDTCAGVNGQTNLSQGESIIPKSPSLPSDPSSRSGSTNSVTRDVLPSVASTGVSGQSSPKEGDTDSVPLPSEQSVELLGSRQIRTGEGSPVPGTPPLSCDTPLEDGGRTTLGAEARTTFDRSPASADTPAGVSKDSSDSAGNSNMSEPSLMATDSTVRVIESAYLRLEDSLKNAISPVPAGVSGRGSGDLAVGNDSKTIPSQVSSAVADSEVGTSADIGGERSQTSSMPLATNLTPAFDDPPAANKTQAPATVSGSSNLGSQDTSHHTSVTSGGNVDFGVAESNVFQYAQDYLDSFSEQNLDANVDFQTGMGSQESGMSHQIIPSLQGDNFAQGASSGQQDYCVITTADGIPVTLQEIVSITQGITSVPQDTPMVTQAMPMVSQEMSMVPQGMAMVPQGMPMVTQGMPMAPQGTPLVPQGITMVPQDLPIMAAQELPMVQQELSSALQETLEALQEIPVSFQDFAAGLQFTTQHASQQTYSVSEHESELLDLSMGLQANPCMSQGISSGVAEQDKPLDYSMRTLKAAHQPEKRKVDDDQANSAPPMKMPRLMDDSPQGSASPSSCHVGVQVNTWMPGSDRGPQIASQGTLMPNGDTKEGCLKQGGHVPQASGISQTDSSHRVSNISGQGSIPEDGPQNNKPEKDRPKGKQYIPPSSTLREADVGICTYIGDHEGFSGIIKERYEDFVVHEINEAHQVIHLTDFSSPEEEKEAVVDVSGVFSIEDSDALNKLQSSEDKSAEHLIDVTSASKELRTKIHTAVRQNYPSLESGTIDKMESKYIKVTKKAKGGGKTRVCKWPKNRPKFCRFVLCKENIDTNEALSLMAKYLRIRPHAFQYAGTKDKRAVTVQEMTIQKFDAKKLAKLNEQLRGIRLGNFRYVDKPLCLGELSGNHFEIVLREVKGDQAQIEQALKSLKENGFVNYFGMQRFGNTSVPTHHIGRAVLKNQWEEAINLILAPKAGDDSGWREHWVETRDARATLRLMPHTKRLSLEKQVLKSLASTTNNFCQAFASIPRNSRMLYLHSFQSTVWNKVATRRIPPRGVFVNTGDLVARKSVNNDNCSWICPEKVEGDSIQKYSCEDIVLPLPGHSVHYPDNEAEMYKEILAEDEITMDHLRHKIKDYSLPGAYRKLVVIPRNVTWSFIKYDDNKQKLIQSDLDRMEGVAAPVPQEDGGKLALKISFSLPTSAYATMALRELMKTETSSAHHAALTLGNQSQEEGR